MIKTRQNKKDLENKNKMSIFAMFDERNNIYLK